MATRSQLLKGAQRGLLLTAACAALAGCGDAGGLPTFGEARSIIAPRGHSSSSGSSFAAAERAQEADVEPSDSANDAPSPDELEPIGQEVELGEAAPLPEPAAAVAAVADAGAAEQVAPPDAAASADASAEPVADAAPASEAEDGGVLLIDTQIVAVTALAHTSEIARAQAALSRLQASDVHALARDMIAQHEAAQARQAALVATKRWSPKENVVSAELERITDEALAELSAVEAREQNNDADGAYLATQVRVQEHLLGVFERVLTRSACDGELKTLLSTLREEIAAQLARARALKNALDC